MHAPMDPETRIGHANLFQDATGTGELPHSRFSPVKLRQRLVLRQLPHGAQEDAHARDVEKDNFSGLHPRIRERGGLTAARRPLHAEATRKRTAHSLFRFRVEVNWADLLKKKEVEVSVSAFQDQSPHFDLGVVMLRPAQQQDDGACAVPGADRDTGMTGEVFLMPEEWTGRKLTQQIEAVNSTHLAFSTGPAEHQGESQLRVFGYCRGDEMESYYSGLLLGVYATSNGMHGERAFEGYVSNSNYTGTQRFRRQGDVDGSNGEV
ncbi:hypothetical protein DL767_010123 [Monosporascus sp. MG133]|nr:hypothetical protein DL767_010123 [Monosporascus sp. MG133]